MSALTQWAGARCREYTSPISSQHELDTTVWPPVPHLSGYGVCSSSHPHKHASPALLSRLCRSKSDTNHSHKARLQDVPHVRSPEHWGDGSVLTVRPPLSDIVLVFTHAMPEQHDT